MYRACGPGRSAAFQPRVSLPGRSGAAVGVSELAGLLIAHVLSLALSPFRLSSCLSPRVLRPYLYGAEGAWKGYASRAIYLAARGIVGALTEDRRTGRGAPGVLALGSMQFRWPACEDDRVRAGQQLLVIGGSGGSCYKVCVDS
jgi:hypothetical protein